jgi:tRNA pseudouridine32 synthase/23S rRNA pseudouridine746 synthase
LLGVLSFMMRDSGLAMSPKEITPEEITPEEMVARVLYRDGLMLVIDKPAGFAVHRGPKGGASLEDYFDALRFGLPRAPSLAHRLDRDTSGCLVLGRHRKALASLGKLFKNGQVGKTYWALVEGGPEADEGRIDMPLGRLDATRGWWMKPDEKGQPAVTTWKVMGRSYPSPAGGGWPDGEAGRTSGGLGEIAVTDPTRLASLATLPLRGRDGASGEVRDPQHLTWLALEPLTGRTHQLRVHCAAMGWPIVGDAIYGSAPRVGGPALQLHSREIVVPLYKNKEPIRVTAPVPEHMRQFLASCGWQDASSDQASAHASPPGSADK